MRHKAAAIFIAIATTSYALHAGLPSTAAAQAVTEADNQLLLAGQRKLRAAPATQDIEVRTQPQACPKDMVLVEGSYCPKVEHRCKRYLDAKSKGRYEHFRCAEYDTPKCLSEKRVTMRFCMDVFEYTSSGNSLPDNFRSFTHAERLCGEQGKRVCKESEWNFACEGEEMRPYPYGFERDPSACNADKFDIVNDFGKLRDLRADANAFPRCVSPFGVRNMAGNLEEFVAIDGSVPVRPAMKGAYWQPSRNHCRAAQTAHDRYYNGMETGFRCCSEPTH